MPSPKSGTAGSLVSPTSPTAATTASNATSGAQESASTPTAASSTPSAADAASTSSAADPNTSSTPAPPPTPPKNLTATLISVTFQSGINVTTLVGGTPTTVVVPHWQVGVDSTDGGGSKKPAAYIIEPKATSHAMTVKVKITANQNVSGATLKGTLGTLAMQGDCPTDVGEHDVAVTIQQLPDSIQWLKGDAGWGLEVPDLGSTIALPSTRLEVFVILGQPATFYSPLGVWAEALRFLFNKSTVVGKKTGADVATAVVTLCHSSMGLKYDTAAGAPAYGCGGGGGNFQLQNYVASVKPKANCYDQAGAVQSLCGALGVNLDWLYLQPFGYINTTNLLGIGPCNNPFFDSPGAAKAHVAQVNDPARSAFGNHAFTQFNQLICDACAGPHTGTETPAQYVDASIDSVTTLYPSPASRGTADQMALSGGVQSVA